MTRVIHVITETGEASIEVVEDGVWLRSQDGVRRTVSADEPIELLTRHAEELLVDGGALTEARSDLLGGSRLAALLEELYGDEFAEEPIINGAFYRRAVGQGIVGESGLTAWIPAEWNEGEAEDPDVSLVMRAHWDLLAGTPSPATGNPGTCTVWQVGDLYVISDFSAEVEEVRAASDPVSALEGLEDYVVGPVNTRIESPWLAREPEHIPALLSAVQHFAPRAIYVNDRLWHCSTGAWTDDARPPWSPDPLLDGLTQSPDFAELCTAWYEGDPRPVAYRPSTGTSVANVDIEKFVLVPTPNPGEADIQTVAHAALKSTAEVARARVCRLSLDDEHRYGLRVADDPRELCRALTLPGWLEIRGGEHSLSPTCAWIQADGTEAWITAASIRPADEFQHPITIDEENG